MALIRMLFVINPITFPPIWSVVYHSNRLKTADLAVISAYFVEICQKSAKFSHKMWSELRRLAYKQVRTFPASVAGVKYPGPWVGISVFSGYILDNPLEKVTVERFLKFQVLLTSSWDRFRRKIPGKKRKFRRAARAGHNSRGGKNKRKSFLIIVSSDQRPHRGVFRPKVHFYVNFQKSMLICTQKCDSWEIKKWSRR